MHPRTPDPESLRRALGLRDLSDPARGPHAMQLLLGRVVDALAARWGCAVRTHRAHPVVSVADNYDRLHYPPGGAARDARYTRYAGPDTLLRTSTTALVPPALRLLAADPPADVLLVCPGLVYRRDTIDRLHVGEPHQADLWRISDRPLGTDALREMVDAAVGAALPGGAYRCNPAEHPYTLHGLEIEVRDGARWVEVGECGLALPAMLAEAGLDARRHSGLAMGLGLDRLLMLAKGIDDIRLLRSEDPRVAAQMLDLAPWRPVSDQPAVRRDLSVATAPDRTPEEIGDRVRQALGRRADALEAVEVLSETPGEELPAAAAERLGILPGQKNVLVRLVIRDLARTLTSAEANELRDAVYAALHEGTAWLWAGENGSSKYGVRST
jgi:phenylalanyl-tRNA synthetase alpha chain